MNDTRFVAEHIRLTTAKSFEEFSRAIERQLGHFDPNVLKSLAAGGDTAEARAKIEAVAGPSGFMLFGKNDHGALFRLVGQMRRAIQSVVGNPLSALQMTQHDIRGLYAPLRCWSTRLKTEKRASSTTDRRHSLAFGDDRISHIAAMLDTKLEELVAAAIK